MCLFQNNAFGNASVFCKFYFETIEWQKIKLPLKKLDRFVGIDTSSLYSMVSYFDLTAHPPVLVEWFSRLLDLIAHFRTIMTENAERKHVPLQPEIMCRHSYLQLVALTVTWNLNLDKGLLQVFHRHVAEDFAYSVET